ncbi:MAG TPA: hypothetical protein VK420_10355 [Longimicrobium sp.]|nr:hypothetical protein [Longimicrobium sp.]
MTDPNESPFQARLRRVQRAIDEGQARQEQLREAWERQLGGPASEWHRVRDEKRLGRAQRRLARRQRMRSAEGESPAQGVVYAIAAVACLALAANMPHLWWLVFVALGMGLSAARNFSASRGQASAPGEREEEREEERDEALEPERQPPVGAQAKDTRSEQDVKVDALCDKLLTEVRSGPNVLREVVRNPEQTVEALRRSCHDVSRRERELRALSTPEDDLRLSSEREALLARIEAEGDEVAKSRLNGALAALDSQRRQRAELSVAASRLGAEHTRLYYTLEALYAQVLRVRSADAGSADVAGAGLRQSLEQLGQEMDAVAEALESVNREKLPGMERVQPIGGTEGQQAVAPRPRERS